MRQGFVRALALGALTVVACAPVASAGAAGGSGTTAGGGGARGATVAAPDRPLTWADVAGRLRQQGRLDPPAVASGGARAEVRAAVAPAPAAGLAPAATAPTLTVTPSTGLKSGDRIDVTGAGFPASEYALVECRTGGTDPGECDLFEITDISPDASGAFSTTQPVHRTLRLYPARFDCTTAPGCELVAIDLRSNFETAVARATLQFDSSAPLPSPRLTATPSTQLRDGQQVAVGGTGWAPGSHVSITQCVTASTVCSGGFGEPVAVGADGSFSASFAASLRANDDFGRLTDCITTACEVRADSFDAPDYFAAKALSFDPSQPIPPPPVITVTPATGLRHQQVVRVTGSGFPASVGLQISECPPSTFGSCPDGLGLLSADSSGSFDVTATVSRLLSSFDSPDPTPVDCAPTGCSISVSTYDRQVALVAAAPIAFDASVPPPPLPNATVTPNSDLPYTAVVAIHGTGFAPREPVYSVFCIDTASVSSCGLFYASGSSDASGVADFSMTVRRRYRFGSTTTLDCTDPGTTCRVEVGGNLSYERVSVPVSFDPSSPIPPPPTASITPDHDLGYEQTVTLTGTNFVPGPVTVLECGSIDGTGGSSTVCFGFSQLLADASGNVSGPVDVVRLLEFGPGSQIDCGVTGTCTLEVVGSDNDELMIPLQFDPSSQPPPPPALTVTPSAGLFDGQHVTVAGTNFRPGTQVGVTECRAGVAAIADGCDLSQVRVATVGADGTFSRRFVTESVLRTSDGPIDCTVRANACVLTAANAPLRTDFAAAPLSFAAPELSVLGVGVTEGTGDMTMAPVQVMLSRADRNPITVHWVADAETASPGTDYTSMRGTLTIPAGATEAMIDAEVVADASDEPTETFRIRVVDALGTKVVDSTGVVTIHDDDAAPTVSIHDTSRREDHGEAKAEVVLSAPSGRTVIVHYVTHHGTARAGTDYVRKDSRLVFLPGETRHLVRVALVDDHVREPTETFQVEIDRVEQATVGRGTATVTITDDD